MLNNIIEHKKKKWIQLSDCPVKDLVKYMRNKGKLRDTQIDAIETYLFLKIEGQNKPLWKLFYEGFFTNGTNLSKQNINRIFPMISNQKMNKALKEIAYLCNFNKKLTFHSARHTFATTVTLTNGVPIETVSKMLGHNNIKTTQLYARVIDSKISSDMLKLRKKFI